MPKMIDLAPTGLRISARLANKIKQKYGLFAKFALAAIGSCEVAKNSHIFLSIENQHIQEINRHFYGILNHFWSHGIYRKPRKTNPILLRKYCCNQTNQI